LDQRQTFRATRCCRETYGGLPVRSGIFNALPPRPADLGVKAPGCCRFFGDDLGHRPRSGSRAMARPRPKPSLGVDPSWRRGGVQVRPSPINPLPPISGSIRRVHVPIIGDEKLVATAAAGLRAIEKGLISTPTSSSSQAPGSERRHQRSRPGRRQSGAVGGVGGSAAGPAWGRGRGEGGPVPLIPLVVGVHEIRRSGRGSHAKPCHIIRERGAVDDNVLFGRRAVRPGALGAEREHAVRGGKHEA
jgi:hypothetical protein